jgi:hypothetical protein
MEPGAANESCAKCGLNDLTAFSAFRLQKLAGLKLFGDIESQPARSRVKEPKKPKKPKMVTSVLSLLPL